MFPKWHCWLLPPLCRVTPQHQGGEHRIFGAEGHGTRMFVLVWLDPRALCHILSNLIPYPTGYPWESPAGRAAEKAGCALSSRASETSSPEQAAGKTHVREELGSAPVKPVVIHSLLWSHFPIQHSRRGASGHAWWRQKHFLTPLLQHRFRNLLQSQLWAGAFSLFFNLKKKS